MLLPPVWHKHAKCLCQCLCQRNFCNWSFEKEKKVGIGCGVDKHFCQGKPILGHFYASTKYINTQLRLIFLAGKSPLEYITYPDIHNESGYIQRMCGFAFFYLSIYFKWVSMGLQTMAYETSYFNSLRVWTTSLVHSLALPESTAVLVAQ